jgi:hypothetical protein
MDLATRAEFGSAERQASSGGVLVCVEPGGGEFSGGDRGLGSRAGSIQGSSSELPHHHATRLRERACFPFRGPQVTGRALGHRSRLRTIGHARADDHGVFVRSERVNAFETAKARIQ